MRDRTIDCRDRGIYIAVMLFQGWSDGDKPFDSWTPDNPVRPGPQPVARASVRGGQQHQRHRRPSPQAARATAGSTRCATARARADGGLRAPGDRGRRRSRQRDVRDRQRVRRHGGEHGVAVPHDRVHARAAARAVGPGASDPDDGAVPQAQQQGRCSRARRRGVAHATGTGAAPTAGRSSRRRSTAARS